MVRDAPARQECAPIWRGESIRVTRHGRGRELSWLAISCKLCEIIGGRKTPKNLQGNLGKYSIGQCGARQPRTLFCAGSRPIAAFRSRRPSDLSSSRAFYRERKKPSAEASERKRLAERSNEAEIVIPSLMSDELRELSLRDGQAWVERLAPRFQKPASGGCGRCGALCCPEAHRATNFFRMGCIDCESSPASKGTGPSYNSHLRRREVR